MDQFNRNNYKKESIFQAFFNSCLGKLVILGIVALILLIIGVMTVPNNEIMMAEMDDNIRQCLQANDSIRGDLIDDIVNNASNMFTIADSSMDDREIIATYYKYNDLRIYPHAFYSVARLHNNIHPEGVRVGLGIFGMVIPTVYYTDLLLRTIVVRRNYNEKLIPDTPIDTDDDLGENPNLNPYHYKGNPDD
jgi:hypothetical protein